MAQTTSEVYRMLRPLIQRQINESRGDSGGSGGRQPSASSGASVQAADYLLYVAGGVAYALDGLTGRVMFSGTNHSTVIQAAIDAASYDKTLAFRAGSYEIGAALAPLTRQTFFFTAGAIFQPTGNNAIWSIDGADRLEFHGPLTIWDVDTVTSSAPAITVEDVAKSHFERIVIFNYYNGINLTGTAGGTHENYFGDLHIDIRNRGLNLETSCHDNHFNHVWIQGPDPENWSTGPGLRIATGGTQGGNIFQTVEVLHCNTGLDLPGAYEVWFGDVLVDNALGIAIYMSGIVEALFFDTIWASSSGTGIQMGGDSTSLPTTYTDKIHINKCYAWLNADYGVRVTGYSQQVMIGNLTVERNAKGIGFEGLDNRDWSINSLYAYDNTEYDICASGVGQNVIVQAALFEKLVDTDLLIQFGGADIDSGKPTQAKGRATIPSGNTSVTVSHGLEAAPVWVGVTGLHSEVKDAYVSAITSTQITLAVGSATSADRKVQWNAESAGPQDDNLVANWSVEDGSGTPTNWATSGGTWVTDDPNNGPSSVAHSGKKGLRINVSASTAWWQSAVFLVEASATYNVRGFFKGAGSTQTFLTIRWWSDAGGTVFISENNITLNATYSGFTLVESDIAAPGTAVSADIVFRCPSSTTADMYGDSFSVRKVW